MLLTLAIHQLLTVCQEELLRDQAITKGTIVYGNIIELACVAKPQARIVGRRIVR